VGRGFILEKALMITLEELREEPYASVICYPRRSRTELKKRLEELQKLGIEVLEFSGEKEAFNTPVLGRGCVGIVTIAYRKGEKMVLKIRRVDADRPSMTQEAKMLQRANAAHVGPRFLGASKNFLLMQFIDGDLLPKWLEKCRERARLSKVLRGVLEQCRRLDEAGLDHGELSHAPKHVIIDNKRSPFIVDFETASTNRKPSNVTSICQFLFMNGEVAKKVAEKLGEKDRDVIIKALRRYKNDRTHENFEKVLEVCSL
jgi:putative serine/threonine protein kinase